MGTMAFRIISGAPFCIWGRRKTMAMIKLENVNKYFGDLHVLKDVNLEVAEGEKLVIIGPSGSGK